MCIIPYFYATASAVLNNSVTIQVYAFADFHRASVVGLEYHHTIVDENISHEDEVIMMDDRAGSDIPLWIKASQVFSFVVGRSAPRGKASSDPSTGA